MKCLKIIRVKLDPGAKEPVRAQEGEENHDICTSCSNYERSRLLGGMLCWRVEKQR